MGTNNLFVSGFFSKDLVDQQINDINQFCINNYGKSETQLIYFKGALNHFSRRIEYPYIYYNIAKFIIENKKNYKDSNFKILDNASGQPGFSYFLANNGMHIQGADINAIFSQDWKDANESVIGSLSFKVSDALNLPFKNEKFDISFCLSSIEQINDPLKAVEEMIRVTKRNGLIVFTMDVTNKKNNLEDFYVNKENFKNLQNLLADKCSYFAPPTFSVPSNVINWEEQAVGNRNFLRKFISKEYNKLMNIEHPNFYIFGSSWIKK